MTLQIFQYDNMYVCLLLYMEIIPFPRHTSLIIFEKMKGNKGREPISQAKILATSILYLKKTNHN